MVSLKIISVVFTHETQQDKTKDTHIDLIMIQIDKM